MIEIQKTKVSATMDREIIGEVRYAFLTEEQFQAQAGTKWILADGRDVTGSMYQQLTGNANVPDCRGQFLRGKNNGRNDGQENPDGDIGLGVQQSDAFQGHKHSKGDLNITASGSHRHSVQLVAPNRPPNWFLGGDANGWDTNNTGYATHTHSNGDFAGSPGSPTVDAEGTPRVSSESRPKNKTVNIFIKIN